MSETQEISIPINTESKYIQKWRIITETLLEQVHRRWGLWFPALGLEEKLKFKGRKRYLFSKHFFWWNSQAMVVDSSDGNGSSGCGFFQIRLSSGSFASAPNSSSKFQIAAAAYSVFFPLFFPLVAASVLLFPLIAFFVFVRRDPLPNFSSFSFFSFSPANSRQLPFPSAQPSTLCFLAETIPPLFICLPDSFCFLPPSSP